MTSFLRVDDNAKTSLRIRRRRYEFNRTEQNIHLFRHSAYIAHSLNTNTAWKRKMKNEK